MKHKICRAVQSNYVVSIFFMVFWYWTILSQQYWGNFVVNLAKKSLVSTKSKLCALEGFRLRLRSASETWSENNEQLSDSFKNCQRIQEFPLLIYPRDKLCAFRFSRRHMEATNMRKVQDIVFVNYFMFLSRSEYFKQLYYVPHTIAENELTRCRLRDIWKHNCQPNFLSWFQFLCL